MFSDFFVLLFFIGNVRFRAKADGREEANTRVAAGRQDELIPVRVVAHGPDPVRMFLDNLRKIAALFVKKQLQIPLLLIIFLEYSETIQLFVGRKNYNLLFHERNCTSLFIGNSKIKSIRHKLTLRAVGDQSICHPEQGK